MIPALHIVLLLLMCGLVCTLIPHANAHDEGGEIMKKNGAHSCECRNIKIQSDVTSILDGIRSLQGSLESNRCSCSHDSRLQKQVFSFLQSWHDLHKLCLAFARFPGPIEESHAYPPLASPVRRSLSTFFARKILAQESRHAAPSPSNNSRSHQGSHSVVSPPTTAQGYAVVPLPSASAPDIETTMPTAPSHSPGPLPHTSQHRRHNHGHHRSMPSKHSPSPVPGSEAAPSPAHEHPSTIISPTPDCSAVTCLSPLTKASFVSRCRCVRPIEVEIELSVPLYVLFPLISVLAADLAKGVVLSPSQVEIVGANASGQNQEFSVVDTNLVPLEEDFDIHTATIISQKFWSHQVVLNRTLFGNYTVGYVHYPGLPPSPPSETYVGGTAEIQKPFAVDVSEPREKKLGTSTVAAITLSSVIVLAICFGAVCFMVLKCRRIATPPASKLGLVPARSKKAGGRSFLSSDLGSSTCLSFTSSTLTYASTARSFTIAELDRATEQFAPENIIGEGGFGRVFCGVLDDGTKVAVKVLTRDHHEGDKEFVSEVEMLSRLHHRNLVKLIGICTEDHSRCLVYELIPNGSVESHLHDKDTCALDWETRMKIALGSARGLAYLHEDSSPRVIHRDFKAGNILLEKDFNPKVSDFGLAKVAPDGGSRHLSTRVMGTFGYVAPEYAMTGHLLVKSDVYSYGVVLLELLTGRKPVDMSQPPGQENLVTWARPLLTSEEGLQVLVDPALKDTISFDSLAKVAAIASMCVHPEVSNRPFMGEVVQALKLVCNNLDVSNRIGSSNCSQGDDSSADNGKSHMQHCFGNDLTPENASFMSLDHDSGSEEGSRRLFRFRQPHASSLIRHSMSGPLRPSQSKLAAYTQAGVQGSISEHWQHTEPLR